MGKNNLNFKRGKNPYDSLKIGEKYGTIKNEEILDLLNEISVDFLTIEVDLIHIFENTFKDRKKECIDILLKIIKNIKFENSNNYWTADQFLNYMDVSLNIQLKDILYNHSESFSCTFQHLY